MDGIHGSNSPMQMSDGQQHSMHHVNYVQEHELHHMSNGDIIDDEHDVGDANGNNDGGVSEAVEGDAPNDSINLSENRVIGDNGDQLTLSFQGQVYVFDSVSPEKVFSALMDSYTFIFYFYFLIYQ